MQDRIDVFIMNSKSIVQIIIGIFSNGVNLQRS